MPTGYTAAIADGIDFKTYAMSCARAFGALVEMRDEPSDAPIPDEFKASGYHDAKIKSVQDALTALLATDEARAERASAKAWDEAETSRLMGLQKKHELRAKYEAMLEKVAAYKAPTAEHQEFHDFMRSQITQSIEFDCSTSYYEKPTQRLTATEWLRSEHERLARDWAYHRKGKAEDEARAASRTQWVKALRESLATA